MINDLFYKNDIENIGNKNMLNWWNLYNKLIPVTTVYGY